MSPRPLREAGDLLNHPLVARGGVAGALLHQVRRGVRVLVRSWLLAQTAFNESVADEIARIRSRLDPFSSDLQDVRAKVAAQIDRLALQHRAEMESLRDAVLGRVEELAREEAAGLDLLQETLARHLQLGTDSARTQERLRGLDARLSSQERRIGRVIEELRSLLPAGERDRLRLVAETRQHAEDTLQIALEDRFRGAPEMITERLSLYLPVIRKTGLTGRHAPVLDLGCGRGEFLDLLKAEGVPAQGVDLNRILVAQCRQRGLEVAEADAVEYLSALAEGSLAAVTAFHLLEHLSFEVTLALLEESFRVLKPGGVAIFETPNPENAIVATVGFHLDPTHQRPLPSALLKTLLEARGFGAVETVPLHPYPEADRVIEDVEVARRFNVHFYGPQDYGMLAWKALAP